jgi:lipoprotein-anchoring transpeptidase ErfK/SrfK
MRRVGVRSATVGVVFALGLSTAACSGTSFLKSGGSGPSTQSSPSAAAFAGSVAFNVTQSAADVSVSTVLKVTAAKAALQSVTVTGPSGPVPGALASSGGSWTASGLLQPNTSYTITAVAVDNHGARTTEVRNFRTRKLTLNQQTYPSFVPADGSTVGIAMPVIIRFDVPVTNHTEFQKHLVVQTSPAQEGAWHWISDNEVHWRPKTYWKAGTTVHVEANIGGVQAAKGVWGQLNRKETFHIGRAQIIKVNIATDHLQVFRSGQLIRTIPVTTGRQPEFTTRSGIKVIVEKDRYTNMNSETIGISNTSAQGYNLKNVEFAMRLTYSGEFLHAAPWSVASQGYANVSHGCTGMSLANAGWLYDNSIIGDPVEYTGSSRPMTLDNGYGDWNLPFAQYAEGAPTT